MASSAEMLNMLFCGSALLACGMKRLWHVFVGGRGYVDVFRTCKKFLCVPIFLSVSVYASFLVYLY